MKTNFKFRKFRFFLYMLIDILIAIASEYFSLLCISNFQITLNLKQYVFSMNNVFYILPVITAFLYLFSSIYKILWSRAGVQEAFLIIKVNLIVSLLGTLIFVIFKINVPYSFYILYFFCLTAFELFFRYSYYFLNRVKNCNKSHIKSLRTMIFGAGEAGFDLGRQMESNNRNTIKLVCYMDDNKQLQGKILNGIPVLGGRNDIARVVADERIDQILISIPSAPPKEKAEVTSICRKTKCQIKTLPAMYQLINGEVTVSKLRPVQIEDLLGREQVKVNMNEIAAYVCNKTVLVTGGGGSIGSELCRQIANQHPRLLIIFDIYENNAYSIQQELLKDHPEVPLLTLIGSVRNTERINQVIRDYRPDIIYHAAAHKHVPLMEDSPKEAIKNNVFGTLKTAEAAAKYGVSKFVLISTDKAVNPTNIMGASKRMCEMVIQMMNNKYNETDFVAVRFGNVLGSNGSVIPLFKKQIEAGGPVTVTDPNIIRYFMTIPEAVSLVLQAGAYAKGGEIFVLDMGEPVKILTLAENLIRLSGFKPYDEIPIIFTGLRPGEKLYEEMLMSEEGLKETQNHMIHIGKPIDFDMKLYQTQLDNLYSIVCSDNSDNEIKKLVAKIIRTYHPQFQEEKYKVTK